MKIKLYDQPFAVVAPKEFEANSVAEWLLTYYGEVPKVTLQIYKGEPNQESEVTFDTSELLSSNSEFYTVLESPGVEGAVAAFLTQVAIALAVSVVMSVLFPPPDMPGNVNRTQQSPNNSLTSRENQVRLNQRVEDIYGTVKAIPSLMMPTYNKYINHKQMEYGYYCVGRGYYEILDLKEGDTLLSNISKSGATVYAPFTSPNSGSSQISIGEPITEGILTVSRPEQVNGITLKAHNQVQLPDTATYTFTNSGGKDRIFQALNSTPNFISVCSIGDTVTVLMSSYSGTNYSGTYVVTNVYSSEIELDTNTWPTELTGVSATVKIVKSIEDTTPIDEWTDWIVLDDKNRTQVWCNVVAPNGMYTDLGDGKAKVIDNFVVQIEQLNTSTLLPTGLVENTNFELFGATSDERAITAEVTTSWVGPARVRMRRTSEYAYWFEGTIVDEIKWRDLYSVTPVNTLHFGNKTTVQTVSQATPRATNVKQRQLNCIASRKLPIYNGSTFSGTFDATGALASGTIHTTSKLVDILAAVCTDPVIGNDISQLDVNQVYSVQQELDAWSEEAGQFNYTFDSDTTSFEETISIIANAGFCIAYRQNGKIRLTFDSLQEHSTSLFTHRNKKPDSESITRKFATDAEYDGVEFVYSDPDSEQSETIKLPVGDLAIKYKKFEIPGIRSFTQAWYRANREYQKLKGQRLSIETTCTTDARLLLPNSRIDIVDNTRFKAYDGEVVRQSGLVLTLSRDVEFTAGSHSILLMKRNGSLDSITCTAGMNANQVVLSRAPVEALVTTPGIDGIRTIFSFASDSARLAQAWLVQEVGVSDNQYVSIKAINYSDDYYFYDTQSVPDSDSIIND